MKSLLRLCGLCALLACLPAWGQGTDRTISRIEIRHVGPAAVSDELIRGHIRIKPGDVYQPTAVDDDVRNLYGTGLFYNIRVSADRATDGMVLVYLVQGRPRLTDIKLEGNKKYSNSKIKKKITSKKGDPLDERKLFTDGLAIQELYQKAGYPQTTVTNRIIIDDVAGRGTVTFQITERPKIKITNVEFVGAQVFPEKKLQRQIKTRKRWMFSWLTGRGKFKEEQFETDREHLAEFYRDQGYIDFEIRDVKFDYPTPKTMTIRFDIYEGQQYKVGGITFSGTTQLPTNAISPTYKSGPQPKAGPERTAWVERYNLNRSFPMKEGRIFAPKGLLKDVEAVEDFYGAKGHVDVQASSPNLQVKRVANTQTGTMDLQFKVDEGQPSYIEKIEIRGNTKTKDRVIRRELAVSPGELYNTVRVKVSKSHLEQLQFFEKVNTRAEDTTIPNRKNLIVSVEEKQTGNLSVGAGFSSVDSIVGFAEVSQGNFDLFNPPTFTGAGQKFRLRVQLGTERQDYIVSFAEPWFLGRRLRLDVELYHRDLGYQSFENLYDEKRTGIRLGLSRDLWRNMLIGSVYYNVESVGIALDNSLHDVIPSDITSPGIPGGPGLNSTGTRANVPNAILKEGGYSLLSRLGGSLTYDTRNNAVMLPDAGQKTELSFEYVGGPLGGDREFYKAEFKTAWYLSPARIHNLPDSLHSFFRGQVLELTGRAGVADSLNGGEVPFYERYYLGGLYSLRGFKYRAISPREPNLDEPGKDEPIGGNSYWFGSAEYSIPIIEKEKMGGVRFAIFYDIGSVTADPYDFNFSQYSDNWGFGLRLNLPIGPLRLDYGIPITHDEFSGSSGRFQFGVGYTRGF